MSCKNGGFSLDLDSEQNIRMSIEGENVEL